MRKYKFLNKQNYNDKKNIYSKIDIEINEEAFFLLCNYII